MCTYLALCAIVVVSGWTTTPAARRETFRTRWNEVAAAVLLAGCLGGAAPAVALDAPPPAVLPQYPPGLVAPTADRPQIMLPEHYSAAPLPLLQGLVYLKDAQQRPDYADTIVITAGTSTTDDDDEVLLGAKIPVTKVSFPMQFNLYRENLLPNKKLDDDADLLVTVRVCPSNAPCTGSEALFQTRGIAKVVRNLPGMRPGDTVRTAASLGL